MITIIFTRSIPRNWCVYHSKGKNEKKNAWVKKAAHESTRRSWFQAFRWFAHLLPSLQHQSARESAPASQVKLIWMRIGCDVDSILFAMVTVSPNLQGKDSNCHPADHETISKHKTYSYCMTEQNTYRQNLGITSPTTPETTEPTHMSKHIADKVLLWGTDRMN